MKITIADNNEGDGDWTGIYIDGDLCEEGHSLALDNVMQLIVNRGGHVESVRFVSFNDDDMDEMAFSLPADESDLVQPRSVRELRKTP